MKNFQSLTKRINYISINQIITRMNLSTKVNITSYNVLSSSLCDPGYFSFNKPGNYYI
jgi:hypothetical protein